MESGAVSMESGDDMVELGSKGWSWGRKGGVGAERVESETTRSDSDVEERLILTRLQ